MSGFAALRRDGPRVHAAWSDRWWGGDDALTALFGAAPSEQSLASTAKALGPRFATPPAAGGETWADLVIPPPGAGAPPADALVVLAGQQPVLAGGPALVAHKAATAIALARRLSRDWDRPVVPVFLIADQDHDTDEVDHVDTFDLSKGALRRQRAGLEPRHAPFHLASWDAAAVEGVIRSLAPLRANNEIQKNYKCGHFAGLTLEAFGPHGLHLLPAHRLGPLGQGVIGRALAGHAQLADELGAGASRLEQLGLRSAFDPADPRPLVLETRAGRRRRVEADDADVGARLRDEPSAFSPHAATRPLVQAAALPVIAQVVGPSELLYLGQARGLHRAFDLTPPVLVPRFEATAVPPALLDDPARADDLIGLAGPGDPADAGRIAGEFADATAKLVEAVGEQDPSLRPKLARWKQAADRGASRLAAAPAWRGRGPDALRQRLRPRGRAQDSVLAWLPEAWAGGDPAAWGGRIVDLCQPLDAPRHVLYTSGLDPA